MAGVPWKAEEIEQLRLLVSKGSTAQEVATALGRSIGSVGNKASAVGIKFNEGKTLPAPEFTVTSAPAGDLTFDELLELKTKVFTRNSERKLSQTFCRLTFILMDLLALQSSVILTSMMITVI